MKNYYTNNISGLVLQNKNRITGTITSVYNCKQSGLDDDPELPWACVCEDHGYIVCHPTLALAISHRVIPEWCEECQSIMKLKGYYE